MNGAKTLAVLVTMGLVGVIGVVSYPAFHTMLSAVVTTNFPPLLAAVITGLPYVLLAVIIYAVLTAQSGK